MIKLRGSLGRTLAASLLAGASIVACGGSGDDDAAPAAGSGNTPSKGGSSGTLGSAGNGDSGAGTGGTGGSASGGTSAKGGSGGTSTSKGGTSGTKGGTGGSTAKGGSGGTAGGSGATSDLLDQIGEACKAECDAQFALACAPASSNTLTCQLSCAAQTTQLGDFCLAEYRDYVQCQADGGYDCVNDSPYPRSTCALQQQAYSQCLQHIGCKRYCAKVADLGCDDAPFDTCLDACIAGDDSLPATCVYSTETIATCQATSSTTCAGKGLDVPATCDYAVLSVAECVSDDSSDLCDGWCYAAEHLGCGGSDCSADCAAKKTATLCSSEWNSLLDCALFFDDAACSGARLIGNGICDNEQQAYDDCSAAGAPSN
jgi:hypothetical protein